MSDLPAQPRVSVQDRRRARLVGVLTATFPGVDFEVLTATSRRVHVRWVDGPLEAAVAQRLAAELDPDVDPYVRTERARTAYGAALEFLRAQAAGNLVYRPATARTADRLEHARFDLTVPATAEEDRVATTLLSIAGYPRDYFDADDDYRPLAKVTVELGEALLAAGL